MKTDKELLELAAKAAGYDTLGFWDEKLSHLWDGEGWSFDPLEDDGDALRLAVKLRINVTPEYLFTGPWEDGGKLRDPYAATRRAIVHAAAEIGEKL
jgi:hypothetical protein